MDNKTPTRPGTACGSTAALLTLLALIVTACEPQGPKALLEGDKLLQQGQPKEALKLLQVATERMPREARAWNHLGLAHQANGNLPEAAQAYSKALALDHTLSAARYNLGTLLLEQDQPNLAVNELTAFTMLQGRDPNGWIKLATAQVRLNRIDAAEISYRTALSLSPGNSEAYNGLGMIQVSKRRYVDAIQFFQAAQATPPLHAPALLNQAVVTHRYLNQKQTALQKYRQYLALQPRPENWESVNAIAVALAEEMFPTNSPRTGIAAAPTPPGSNIVQTPRPGTQAPSARQGAAPAVPANTVTRPAAATPPPTQAPVVAQAPTPSPLTPTPAPAPTLAPAPRTNVPPPVAAPPGIVTSKPTPAAPPVTAPEPAQPPLAVSEVAVPTAVRPAQEIVPPRVATPASPPVATEKVPPPPAVQLPPSAPAAAAGTPPAPEEKPGFFARINPFRNRNKFNPPPPTQMSAVTPPPPAAPATPEPAPPGFKRYAYTQSGRPVAGDRQKSAELVHKGILAHEDRRFDEEYAHYRSATLVDPASFDAFFNLGLMSAERGDWTTAAACYEQALKIDPDSINGRYNFAVALRQGDYPVDAARELEAILQSHPKEAKVLLALGNLNAQRLKQTRTARMYYLRFLESEPNHPRAAEVRFWLSSNP